MKPDKHTPPPNILKNRQKLSRMSGRKKLTYLLSLIKTAERHQPAVYEEFIDDNLPLIESMRCEESALLLGHKSFFRFQSKAVKEADLYADKGLKLSRELRSNEAEAKALTIKGYVNDVMGQHKKVVAWYIMALEKCAKPQKAGLLLDLGTSFSKQGEYDRARAYLLKAAEAAGNLARDKSVSRDDQRNQTRIRAEAWSRLGPVLEGIGDFDGAEETYEKAITVAEKNGFVWEHYKALSRKAKLLMMRKRLSEAKSCLDEAEKLANNVSGRATTFIAHDWARFYRAAGRYADALDKYEAILYGSGTDGRSQDRHVAEFMTDQADLFGEIIAGITDCLEKQEKEALANRIESATRAYRNALDDSGIYKEADKQALLSSKKRRLINILRNSLERRPLSLNYRNIVVYYDPEQKKASVTKNGQQLSMSARTFLTLKYLIDKNGACVPRKEIIDFWEKNQEHAENPAVVRQYISRDLRRRLGLDQFIKECPGPIGGWRLLPE